MINQARKFAASLHPRERVNCDVEDAITVIWLAISDRDHKWSPEKGEYISFAGPIIHNALYRLREECRTVPSPRNTSCRLREYRDRESSGTLSKAQAKTREDINRTISGTLNIVDSEQVLPSTDTVSEDVESHETETMNCEAIRMGIEILSSREASVVAFIHGLWGNPQKSVSQIAMENGQTSEQVRRVKHRAYEKILDFLNDTKHPTSKKGSVHHDPEFGAERY